MNIAVEGCCHGELDAIYSTIEHIMRTDGITIDLLLCCGDFQAVRDEHDLDCVAVKPKYRKMHDFHKYYTGESKAPVLTIFIGGNHEAVNHHAELRQGGWVAPNIYYLGYSGVVRFGGLRIAGVSGIFKPYDYQRGYFEQPPFDEHSKISLFHTREFEIFKLLQIQEKIDIMLSHDWPRGIVEHGNHQELFRRKPFLRNERETFGSPAVTRVLQSMQPDYWFAAHMHCKFAALVDHSPQRQTKFLALDKVIPGRDFLQILRFPDQPDKSLRFDLEWLSVVLKTQHLFSTSRNSVAMPSPDNGASPEQYDFRARSEELAKQQQHANAFDDSIVYDPNNRTPIHAALQKWNELRSQ